MKKMIALILALVLILSLSITASAEELPSSPNYYVYLEDNNCEIVQAALYFQPEECNGDVLPEDGTTDPEFEEYVENNWVQMPLNETLSAGRDNLYSIFLIPWITEYELTGNFLIAASYYDENGVEQVFVTDLLNFFNGKNTVVIDLGDATTEPSWRYERNGYITGGGTWDQCFVYGTRGEAITTGDVVSVDLEWGSMEFVYTPEQTIWNPSTHEYEPIVNDDGSTPGGWSVAEGSDNHITVTNHSNVSIQAIMEFTAEAGKNINGYFDYSSLNLDSAEEAAYNSPEKAPTGTVEFNIIRCELTEETAGALGTITITISLNPAA